MAANLIARYIWEVNALAKARHGLSLEELNEQWRDSYLYDDKDIVRKTWWEHRNQIGVQFGIDIEFDKQNKRYFIKSRNEINRPAIQEWLLDSFAVGNMLLQGKDLHGRILCEHIPSGYEYLTEIIQACAKENASPLPIRAFGKRKRRLLALNLISLKYSSNAGILQPDRLPMRNYEHMLSTAYRNYIFLTKSSKCPRNLMPRKCMRQHMVL